MSASDALAVARKAQSAAKTAKSVRNSARASGKSTTEAAAHKAAMMAASKAAYTNPYTAAAFEAGKIAHGKLKEAAAKDPEGAAAQTLRTGNAIKKAAPVAAGVAAFQPILALMALLNFMKTLFFGGLALLSNIGSALLGMILGAAKAVFGAIATAISGVVTATLGAAVASVITIPATVALTVFSLVAGVVGVGQISEQQSVVSAARDESYAQCSANVRGAMSAANATVGDVSNQDTSESTKKNAKTGYNVLKTAGYRDEAIAGVLGNFDHESGIDPTGVETIFNEPFTMGPRKKQAEKDNFEIVKIDASYAARFPAIKIAGIGLGGWTNERSTGLTDFAKKIGKSWYTMETQLAYMMGPDSGSGKMREFKSQNLSVDEATDWFRTNWEGNTALGGSESRTAAQKWFAQMKSWKVSDSEKKDAQSLLDQAAKNSSSSVSDQSSDGQVDANSDSIRSAKGDCLSSEEGNIDAWDGDLGSGEWTAPCPGCAKTSGWDKRDLGNGVDAMNGGFHWGADLLRPDGKTVPIIAPTDITITDQYLKDGCVFAKQNASPNFSFGFCHMSDIKVKVGDKLKKGDIIGQESNVAGNIGGSVPIHLHLELYEPGSDPTNFAWFNNRTMAINPEPVFRAKGAWVKGNIDMPESELKPVIQHGPKIR